MCRSRSTRNHSCQPGNLDQWWRVRYQTPTEHVRPALHVPLPKHWQLALPVWQLEPLPQPALRARAVPIINTRNLSTNAVPLILDLSLSLVAASLAAI